MFGFVNSIIYPIYKKSDHIELELLACFRKKMEMKGAVVVAVLLLLLQAADAAGCPDGDEKKECKECILDQLKCGCPECRPRLRCFAGCLWNGVPQGKCMDTCDSPKGKLRLSGCKKCLSVCKCSCVN
ncbi:hypothetical protein Cni_G28268 [Canna indica]|uniref:Uncharacterized protein n=1 Tax=Canna indica TaxID=4628 RepID=A0AAQ3QSZ7_9LILI|nr:hypothetical protein Cni_G28268 [Canna indica]